MVATAAYVSFNLLSRANNASGPQISHVTFLLTLHVQLNYYWSRRSNLYVPPSISDPLTYSAYRFSRNRKPGFTDPDKLVELVAVYYAMIEEVDHYIGLLLDKLETSGLLNSTMIVVTSDHGEMMGSHGMQGKGLLYEEATRVPLIMVNQRQFPSSSVGTLVKEPVSHLDTHATILDYLGASQYDTGDGKSLRRFIEKTSYNQYYDERVAVVEDDGRFPVGTKKLAGKLGDRPNFLIRNGRFKLTLPRQSNSTVADMMFDLTGDPLELVNLLRDPRSRNRLTRPAIIGKAEHLKILLLEFLQRNNGAGAYYSSPRYHLGGRGDIKEISLRRTWEKVNYWHSDSKLSFGPPSLIGSEYVRNEYWYVGRTNVGSFQIQSVTVTGTSAAYFRVAAIQRTVPANGYVRIKVSFRSTALLNWTSLNATLVVKNTATGTTRIPLVFE
jgi:Sulfatase